jgi:hypothetical protein
MRLIDALMAISFNFVPHKEYCPAFREEPYWAAREFLNPEEEAETFCRALRAVF